MFTKSNLLATLVTAVVMFFLGFLIWGVATVDIYKAHTINDISKDPPDFLFIILGQIISAFALSTLYGKWSRGHHSAKEGAEFGALIGLFFGFGTLIIMYATTELFTLTGHLIDGVLEIVFYTIAGVSIALVYKATSPKK